MVGNCLFTKHTNKNLYENLSRCSWVTVCLQRGGQRGILISTKENTNTLKAGYRCSEIPQSLDRKPSLTVYPRSITSFCYWLPLWSFSVSGLRLGSWGRHIPFLLTNWLDCRVRGKILSSIPGPFSSVTNTASLSVHAAYWLNSLSLSLFVSLSLSQLKNITVQTEGSCLPVWRVKWHCLRPCLGNWFLCCRMRLCKVRRGNLHPMERHVEGMEKNTQGVASWFYSFLV